MKFFADQDGRAGRQGTALHDQLQANLVDGTVEILVPRSADDEAVRVALSAYTWSWRFV